MEEIIEQEQRTKRDKKAENIWKRGRNKEENKREREEENTWKKEKHERNKRR